MPELHGAHRFDGSLVSSGPVVFISLSLELLPAACLQLPGVQQSSYLGTGLRAVTILPVRGCGGSATSLPDAGLLWDVHRGHLVPCASVSSPGNTGPRLRAGQGCGVVVGSSLWSLQPYFLSP